jgi:hypothetical protein
VATIGSIVAREHRAGDIGTVEIGIKIAGMVYVAA